MVLQHKLPEVTSRVVLNAIQLPGYSAWLPASVGPRDMGMVSYLRLPEVTSKVVLNAIQLPGYSGYQHLWVLGTWVWCSNTSYLRLLEVTSRVVLNNIQLPGYSGYQHLWVLGTWVWCSNTGYHLESTTILYFQWVLWLPASEGPRDMGMVLQDKLPEVT